MNNSLKNIENALKWIWTKLLFVSVIIIYFIGVYLIINGFYLLITKQQTLANTILILAGAVASLSVVYLAEQVRTASEQEKVKISYDYFTRYNSESFLKTTKSSLLFLHDTAKSPDKRMKILTDKSNEENMQTKFHLQLYFNFFEDMAILYNKNYLNRNIIISFFKSISLQAYEKGADYISYVRGKKPTNFQEWEKMNKDFLKRKITGEK